MSLFGRKPESLGEVVRRVKAGRAEVLTRRFENFSIRFYANADSRQQAITERPASIDAVHDAYVAAVAEHLARRLRVADTGLERDPW